MFLALRLAFAMEAERGCEPLPFFLDEALTISDPERFRSVADCIHDFARDRERVVLGLRRAAGVISGEAGRALLASGDGGRLLDAGILCERDDRLVVGRPLLGDEVARAVLALAGDDC